MKLVAVTLLVAAGFALNLSLGVLSSDTGSTEWPPGELHCAMDLPWDPNWTVFECPPSEPGEIIRLPYWYNCRKYIECFNGNKTCFHCNPGTIWNDTIKTCDDERYTDCIIVTTPVPPFE